MRQLRDDDFKGIASELSPTQHAIQLDPGDGMVFEDEVLENSSRLQTLLDEHQEEYPPLRHLVEDIYYTFFKYKPELSHPDSVELDYILNHQVIQRLQESNQYKEFRASTKLDQLSSQIATEVFSENIMDLIKKIAEEQEEKKQEAQELKEKIEDLKEELEEKGMLPDDKQYTLEEAKKELSDKRQEMKEKFDQKKTRKLEQKIQVSKDDTQGVEDCIQNWGLGNDGTFQKMGYRDKIDMVNKLKSSKKLNKISLLAGKLKEIYFEGKNEATKRTKSTLKDIEHGNNIGRTIPTDLASLVMPGRKRMFYKRYSEKRLRQHQYGGKAKKGKGPIVALIDTSSSMSGQSEIWSKAVALTLLDIARKQKRSFFVVHFDSGTHKDNLHTNHFPKHDPYDIQEVIDMAEYFGGGGTEFEPPLDRAKDQINNEREFTKADIIMITDGQSAVRDKWLNEYKQWKDKKNVVIYSIVIDQGGYASTKTLEEFSNTIQKIDDLKGQGSAVAVDIFDHLDY